MKKILLTTAFVSLFGLTPQLFAQTPPAERTPSINRTERQERRRIRRGVRNGSLTPREARRLRAHERAIQRRKMAAKANGVVTPAERRQLRRAERRQNRRIRRLTHNRRRRY